MDGSYGDESTEKGNTKSFDTLSHDLENPIYGPGASKDTTNNCNNNSLDKMLDVPNPYYNEYHDPIETTSTRSFKTSPEADSRPRVETFPYVMDGEVKSKLATLQKTGNRVDDVVYDSPDLVFDAPSSGSNASTTYKTGSAQHSEYEDVIKGSEMSNVYYNTQPQQMCDYYDDIVKPSKSE